MPSGIYKRTEECRTKLSQAQKKRFANGAKPNMGMLGRKVSEETRNKRSMAMKGRIPKNLDYLLSPEIRKKAVAAAKTRVNELNHFWKGEKVSYRGLHKWVERHLGKPCKCSDCGKVGYGRQIHWANKSGEYKRELADWMRLCASCHGEYDKERGFRKHLEIVAN